ncbi:hypothetical protein G7Z17_g3051 [Cylindrodendrum hubeiense]|uniref:FAD-binding PCMH-type domain-containing protein n=1 Tax=Cylindrodendrum hubeiense TaxID=595255 RepID=A0A9P5HHM3_9HYPO|nr:hypothetical protein G7Z17_g3051 [Cylindrodendrum hubeiense]
MVALEDIRSSNSKIATVLRPGLVAVFAGATSGIGETSLKNFAKNAVQPRIYFIGRSKESGSRISAELRKLNPEGEYIYKSVDVSLLHSVDNVCREIKEKEATINLLFLSTGTMVSGKDTEEGLSYPVAVAYYARLRFIVNLLPLLRDANDLRRVVTVLAGTKEGTVHTDDLQGRKSSMTFLRGHFSSMTTLTLEAVAKNAPNVSFIHVYPGFVKTNIGKDVKGPMVAVLRTIFDAIYPVIGPIFATPVGEAGERHLFLATSAMFPAGRESVIAGVPAPGGATVARGTNGKRGSGVYSITNSGETAPPQVEQLLEGMRNDGTAKKVWSQVEKDRSDDDQHLTTNPPLGLAVLNSLVDNNAAEFRRMPRRCARRELKPRGIPVAIAFPSTAIQVAHLVECAVASGYKVQPKSGGHSPANYGSSTGELSINLQNLQHFSMDKSTFRASIGPGYRMRDVDELMYNSGQRFVPHGSSGHVGLGGHGTVGGAGYAWRKYGLTIDYIQEVEVVLADATIVRASASKNPDLFFAIRGAGASFGIVTEYVFKTLPAPAQTVSFTYLWTATDVPSRAAVFKAWQALTYNSSVPWALETIGGATGSSIYISGAYFGTLDDFNALGIPSLLPPAQTSSVSVFTNFLELSQQWASQNTATGRESPSFFYLKSAIFRPETRIPDNVVDQLFEYISTTDSGTDDWDLEFQAGGGKNGAFPSSETAFPHRDASFVALLYATTSGIVTATTTSFLDGLHALARSGNPDAYYGEYAGFTDAKEEPDQARYHYYGSNLKRLEKVKAAYDPLNVFYNHQGVLPNGAANELIDTIPTTNYDASDINPSKDGDDDSSESVDDDSSKGGDGDSSQNADEY